MLKQFSLQKIMLLSVLAFLFIPNSNLYCKDYLHRVYVDTVDNFINSGIATWGDSSAIYTGFAKTYFPKIFKSVDLGYTWDVVYTEWVDEDNHYSFSQPFYHIRQIEHPAPGYTYLLYDDGNIKHLDERTGKIIDSVNFNVEYWEGQSRVFDMYDSITGVLNFRGRTFVTHDGWKTYLTSIVGVNINDDSTYSGFGMWPSRFQMLSPDTVLFWGHCFIDSVYRVHSFNKLIIEEDSTFRYELFADTLLDIDLLDGVRAFEYFSDTLMYFILGGRKTGYGDCKEMEIYKMSGTEHQITQIYRNRIPKGFFGLEDLEFKDELNGIVAGDNIIITTSDGGNTWEVDTVFYDENWEDFGRTWWWNPKIDYVDNMLFITTWNADLWKLENEKQSIKREEYIHPKIYPNPVQAGHVLNIENRSFLHATAYIYDIQGNEVDSFDFYGNSLPIRADLPAGAYILIVEENGKYPVREKFIIE